MKKTFCSLLSFLLVIAVYASEAKAESTEIERFLQTLFQDRSHAMITKDFTQVMPYYLSDEKTSRQALQHEKLKSVYIHEWAAKRNVIFIGAESEIRVARINQVGDKAKIFLIRSERISYQHHGNVTPHTFGIGTRHVLTLQQKANKWHVLKEWYLDPLEENANLIPVLSPAVPEQDFVESNSTLKRKKYNREKAVSYANKYAGAAIIKGKVSRYNPKYLDYTYKGGDCTNFASQVLGDAAEGGGLPMRGNWRSQKQGSVAWVRTDAFYRFLIHSGYGKVIARGTYEQVAKPNKKFPQSALALLKPGDLIAYELDGDIDHFSIVTARDHLGYTLVNSHTADRYHVPWDLGWDKTTKFHLIHIND